MGRRAVLFFAAVVCLLLGAGALATSYRPFPPETSPEGAYARIALCIAQRRPRDAFPYLETEAQWAAYTIRDLRKKACDQVRASYPPGDRELLLDAWQEEGDAPEGADVFALLAIRRGWMTRLERDLSGATHADVQGDRATVVTARGTRYPFRRRDNRIWGLTLFTAELRVEAERAARDLDVVEHSAADYDRVGLPARAPFSR
jgi:hypothetical protein